MINALSCFYFSFIFISSEATFKQSIDKLGKYDVEWS